MSRERDKSGRYTDEISLQQLLTVFEQADVPVLTASEVADAIGCSRAAAYNKLEKLTEQGEVQKKTVGARAVVYIRLKE